MTRTNGGRFRVFTVGLVASWLLAGSAAVGHPERATQFPTAGSTVPSLRADGGAHVVCAHDSADRVETLSGSARTRNEALLEQCGYESVQAAIDAAGNGDRVLILPGVYTEPHSRAVPVDDPRCADQYTYTTHGDARGSAPGKYQVPTYEFHRRCPNARNLVAVIGDSPSDPDRACGKCNLQIEGTGDDPTDVVLQGDRRKMDVLHADRAHGLVVANLTVEHGAFNGLNVIETSGYRLERVVARYNQNYGVLTFTTDNGLYDRVETHHNGHAGLYPGSTAERRGDADGSCAVSVELREVRSHHNTYGYSGTGANSVWLHDSRIHDNAVGVSTDSVASAHPGMPQDCAVWEDNLLYSNNYAEPYSAERAKHCQQPYHERNPELVCPYWAAPIGTAIQIIGGNDNVIRRNRIYDNHRSGARLAWFPAALRYDVDPQDVRDTSHRNRFEGNVMGLDPDGRPAPNGQDFWWDEQGEGNCWSGNGAAPTSDPAVLPACPEGSAFSPGNPVKIASQLVCITYDPKVNTSAPGCPWLVPPRRPDDPSS